MEASIHHNGTIIKTTGRRLYVVRLADGRDFHASVLRDYHRRYSIPELGDSVLVELAPYRNDSCKIIEPKKLRKRDER